MISLAESHDPIVAAAQIGRVGLYVTDLARSLDYYEKRIGLKVLRKSADSAALGVDGKELLALFWEPDLRSVAKGCTGLYHFALLVPSRKALGQTLRHLLRTETRIDGASDHGVSEALYLSDPDGHGIEIYRDRKQADWPLDGKLLRMTLDPLDAEGLLAAAGDEDSAWSGMASGTTIGHVHLHVADLDRAEVFYRERLGFSVMQRFAGSASFLAAGGYHHHLGINVWAGVGAPAPPDDTARLAWWEVVLPSQADLDAAAGRIREADVHLEASEEGWSLVDPSGNRLVLRIRA